MTPFKANQPFMPIKLTILLILACAICILAVPMSISAEKVPTSLTIGLLPESPSINESFHVSGILNTTDGKPLGNKRITLESSLKGADDIEGFAYISLKETDSAGKYDFFRPSNSPPEFLRVKFTGNDDFEPATSRVIAVRGAGTDHPQTKSGGVGSIMITTKPEGADVYVDDIMRGVTPIKVAGLSEGSHIVNVTKNNYQNETVDAYVTSDNDASVDITLK